MPRRASRVATPEGREAMAFITTVPVSQATGEARAIYEQNQARVGYVPNYAKAFSLRPTVMATWGAFLGSIRGNLDPRRYELVTVAAARALRSSYCSLVHGQILRERFYTAPELAAIVDGDARAPDARGRRAHGVRGADRARRQPDHRRRRPGAARPRPLGHGDLRRRRRGRRALLLQQAPGRGRRRARCAPRGARARSSGGASRSGAGSTRRPRSGSPHPRRRRMRRERGAVSVGRRDRRAGR